ncbi:alanine racemase [Cellulosimicrobium cellulans]|uniref:alanine racemase n=1 Tax=Cellulosimicrobium cellulans TaxID=1710 RepID=UPI0020969185|nr:alanine racemase [Cellulosimicrobium cellulans]MCO7273984.1 alanine racemase [Cellulosimicrobium cellulans]
MTTDAAPAPGSGTRTGTADPAGDERGATPSLLARLTRATADLDGPLAVVDLDRFDANADELLARAGGVPVRVASKSVRVRSLVTRAGERGFRGVMAFSVREALWLVDAGVRDVLVGYPSVDRGALAALARHEAGRREITLMVDDAAHLELVRHALAEAGTGDAPPVRVCLDVDASLRVGLGLVTVHLGTRRSPLHDPPDVASLAARVVSTPGLSLRGLMFYEAQVAGMPDSSLAVRAVKRLSVLELGERRGEVVAAVRDVVGHDLELVNSGGTGSLETSSADGVVTEVTAGSGLYVPGLFDEYRSFRPRPSAFFGLDVVRVPAPGWATAFGGGYVASGPASRSRLPRVATPGWSLTGREGAGEVQTPLHRTRGVAGAPELGVGDRVWFRHGKAGEAMERFDRVHLVRGDEVVDVVPTYRGEGKNFG